MNFWKQVVYAAVICAIVVRPLASQHAMHNMEPNGGWRMVPMDMNMPMLPGLEGAVPIVSPFLPGSNVNLESIPLAVPSEIVRIIQGDTLELSVSMVRRNVNGREVIMFGYNGQYPGPMIEVTKGSTAIVRVKNEIEMPTTVHWHGIRLENQFDGVPGVTQESIATGEHFVYEVKVPDAGMYWYHPHVREDVQQDLGLYGNLLVKSPDPEYYGAVHREEVLIVDDLLMDSEGVLPWGSEAPTHALMGRFGNVMLVNGQTEHSLNVDPGEVVRFYITNVANSRTFNITFGTNRVKLVASDVSRYQKEQWISSVVIAPGERYVVDVQFEDPGQTVIANTIQAVNHFRGEFYPHVDTLSNITVSDQDVENDLDDEFGILRENSEVISEIQEVEGYFNSAPDYELETTVQVRDLPTSIVISMESDTFYVAPMEWNDAMPMMNWLSSGEQVTWVLREKTSGLENDDIQWEFNQDDIVKIRIFNSPDSFHPMNHPIHIHGQRFLVLERDGIRNQNLVWKDTAILPVGSTMDLLVEMSNPGEWMFHCHIAEHLHAGMAFNFTVH